MSGLIPFNRKSNGLARSSDFDVFHSMLDDFFGDSWLPGRNLLRDTFKIDIEETDEEYRIEAELPGVQKSEIDLSADDDILCISVNREEEVNKEGKNYIHRERRASSMSRRVRLAGANLDAIKARLDNGVLTITLPKGEEVKHSRKIDIE